MHRSRYWVIRGTLIGAAAALVGGSVAGQSPQQIKPRAGTTLEGPAAAQADEIFHKALAGYRQARTYQDSLVMSYDVKTKGDSDGFFGALTDQRSSLAFERPNRLAFESDEYEVRCDGETLWTAIKHLQQFKQEPAPSKLDMAKVLPPGMDFLGGHPAARMLTAEGPNLLAIFPEVKSAESVTVETLNGEIGHRLVLAAKPDVLPMEAPLNIEMWFSDPAANGATGAPLLKEMRIDMTGFYKAMSDQEKAFAADEQMDAAEDAPPEDDDLAFDDDMAMPEFERFVILLKIEQIHIDRGISAERFVYTPDDESKKVDEFDFSMEGESSTVDLLEQPAPAFSGKDLEGQSFSLADFKGKVVLLDFWATWCGPCVQAIPHIQKIADRFQDKPVVVVGMNQDAPGDHDKVKGFLEKRKITFRQRMPAPTAEDADDAVSESYLIRGIPTTVLIDQSGVIRRVHIGFSPELVDELSRDIEKLLAGQPLDPPDVSDELDEEIAE